MSERLLLCDAPQVFGAVTHLQDVASDIISEGPAQTVEDVQHLFLLEHGEKAVEEDLEPDGNGLGAVQHQAADVKHHIGLNDLHLGRVVEVLSAELVQSCIRGNGRQKKRKCVQKKHKVTAYNIFPCIGMSVKQRNSNYSNNL